MSLGSPPKIISVPMPRSFFAEDVRTCPSIHAASDSPSHCSLVHGSSAETRRAMISSRARVIPASIE